MSAYVNVGSDSAKEETDKMKANVTVAAKTGYYLVTVIDRLLGLRPAQVRRGQRPRAALLSISATMERWEI